MELRSGKGKNGGGRISAGRVSDFMGKMGRNRGRVSEFMGRMNRSKEGK